MNKKLFLAIATAGIAAGASSAVAAPLPNGTKLLLTPGNAQVLSDPDFLGNPILKPCTIGSCFGMFNRPTKTGTILFDYYDILPGTDGGFILGKAQTSGGQELAPSALNSAPGQLTAPWAFGGAYGTFFTAPDSTGNIFDDTSCLGAACLGKTELKVFTMAWFEQIIPLGSAAGCNKAVLPSCTADQVAGIFVTSWTVTPVAGSTSVDGASFELIYSQVVPVWFYNHPFQAILRGTVSLGNVAPVVAITPANLIGVYGTAIPFAVTVTDPDGAAPTCRVGTSPANGTVVLNGCTGGTYAANRGFIGTDSFTVIANDTQADGPPTTVNVAVTAPPITPTNTPTNSPTNTPMITPVTGQCPHPLHPWCPTPSPTVTPVIPTPTPVPSPSPMVHLPIAHPVNLSGNYGIPLTWVPNVQYATECRISTAPANGVATIASNCSTATYTANIGFVGTDSFTYIATGPGGDSAPGTVTAVITAPPTGPTPTVTPVIPTVCTDQYPLSQISVTGKRGTLTVVFSGNIVSSSNKAIKICPSTSLNYSASTSKTGASVTCKVRHSRSTGTGTLKVNDELQCKDKPIGNDKVQIKVKSGENRR